MQSGQRTAQDRVAIPFGVLQPAAGAGREVIRPIRALDPQGREVDHIDVCPHAGGQDAAVVEAEDGRGVPRLRLDHLFDRHRAAPDPGPVLP